MSGSSSMTSTRREFVPIKPPPHGTNPSPNLPHAEHRVGRVTPLSRKAHAIRSEKTGHALWLFHYRFVHSSRREYPTVTHPWRERSSRTPRPSFRLSSVRSVTPSE